MQKKNVFGLILNIMIKFYIHFTIVSINHIYIYDLNWQKYV